MQDTKENIVDQLLCVESVSTTADMCHWIDFDELIRKSALLAFRRFKGQHTYDRIATVLSAIHAEYERDTTKISYVITDNCSNFLKAFKEYGAKVGDSESEPDEEEEGNHNDDQFEGKDVAAVLNNPTSVPASDNDDAAAAVSKCSIFAKA